MAFAVNIPIRLFRNRQTIHSNHIEARHAAARRLADSDIPPMLRWEGTLKSKGQEHTVIFYTPIKIVSARQ